MGNHILFLFVGPTRVLFTLHTDLLPEATQTYINQHSQGHQTFQLPNEDANIMNIYRNFLYSHRIFSKSPEDEDMEDDGKSEAHNDAEWTKLAHCYLFAITVQDERFANASINAIVEKMQEIDRYPTGIAGEVYQYTQPGDKLRQLIVDVHVRKGLGNWVRPPHDDAEGPKEFLQDVINGLVAVGGGLYEDEVPMPWEAKCRYHTHVVTRKCEG